jgi:hypothetical protein
VYIRGGEYILMQLVNDVSGTSYYTATYNGGNTVDTIEEAREQLAECIAEDDAANPNTYKIFQLTPVEA